MEVKRRSAKHLRVNYIFMCCVVLRPYVSSVLAYTEQSTQGEKGILISGALHRFSPLDHVNSLMHVETGANYLGVTCLQKKSKSRTELRNCRALQ